jgi:type I restriction enzyme R subunit
VRLIDFENPDANDWWVINQFPVEGRSPRRPDIVLLINLEKSVKPSLIIWMT